MKIALCLVLCLSAYAFGQNQNLIPNPGFEQVIGCPGAMVFLDSTLYWKRIDNHSGTPDQYYGDCPYNGIINPMARGQRPYEGIGYAGGFVFYRDQNQCEYLMVELTEPMQKDSVYFIEFYVLPSPIYGNFIDSYGVHFSTNEIKGTDPATFKPILLEEHVGNPRGVLIGDTLHWTAISGTYKANGGERFATFGNFRNSDQTNYENFSDEFNHIVSAYMFIDGVTVKIFEPEDTVRNQKIKDDFTLTILPSDTLLVDVNTDTSETFTDLRKLNVVASFQFTQQKIKITIFDDHIVDHDTVQVLLDDEIILDDYCLKRRKKTIELTLEPGTYYLKLVAINLGDVPPNTAAVILSDGILTRSVILESDTEKTSCIEIIVL